MGSTPYKRAENRKSGRTAPAVRTWLHQHAVAAPAGIICVHLDLEVRNEAFGLPQEYQILMVLFVSQTGRLAVGQRGKAHVWDLWGDAKQLCSIDFDASEWVRTCLCRSRTLSLSLDRPSPTPPDAAEQKPQTTTNPNSGICLGGFSVPPRNETRHGH